VITRKKVGQFIIIILFHYILLSQQSFSSEYDLPDIEKSYFSIYYSPDRSWIALTNSNYTTLEIMNQEMSKSIKVPIPFLNTFNIKWSPDSDKLLLLRSRYNNKRRSNSLIVINRDGDLLETIVDFTNQNLSPLGWTGNNTLHYLDEEEFVTYTLKGSDIEWGYPLVYAVNNKLFKKVNNRSHDLLFTADNTILNVSSSKYGNVVAFEIYGSSIIIIDNLRMATSELKMGNRPKVFPDGGMVTFMVLEDDGYQITKGDIFIWNAITKDTKPVANDPDLIEMNPVWYSNELVSYIIYPSGFIETISIE